MSRIHRNRSAVIKNLIILRHAKSSWNHPGLSDRERPLNARGERDAPFMGAQLKAGGLIPDAIVCSPAVRARSTARAIAGALGYPEDRIVVRDAIYERGRAGLMEVIQALDAAWNRVILIGHNPDLTLLINRLAGEDLPHLPTCGLASIVFEVDDWKHVMDGAGRMTLFDYPKRHAREERRVE